MDRMSRYRDAVREMVEEFANYLKPNDGTQIEAITDDRHGHYQIVRTGWKNGTFVDDCLLHLAIRTDEKIHLLQNRTELEVDHELMRRGVPFEDIVPTRKMQSAQT